MSEELRVVIPHLINKTMNVLGRDVWVNDESLTDPLTFEQYKRLTSIGFPCWTTYKFPVEPDPEALVVLSPAELARIEASGFRLVPRDTPLALEETYPDLQDVLDKGDMSEDEDDVEWVELQCEWFDLDEAGRVELVQELEQDPTGLAPVLIDLFELESQVLNSPAVLAALEAAIQRLRPTTTAEQINTALVARSAEGKVTTKNPPTKKTKKPGA